MRTAAQHSVAVGFFDGVHLGHRAILSGADAAVTFRNHPLTVLAPERAPDLIMSAEARVAALGVPAKVLDFTPELAAMSPDGFLELAGLGRETVIRCGANWRFGKGGAGSPEWLRAQGRLVEVVPYAEYAGSPVSSSRIRAALKAGDLGAANAMLGRAYSCRCTSVAGKGLGRKLGFPTVNLPVSLMLPDGVYAVEANGAPAVANYGVAPTLGAGAWPTPVLEVHFLGEMPQGVADREVEVSFRRFLRPERKFASTDDLARQLAEDCAEVKRFVAHNRGDF